MHGHLDVITLFDQRHRDNQRVARDSGNSQGAVAEQAAMTRPTSGALHATPLDRKAHGCQCMIFLCVIKRLGVFDGQSPGTSYASVDTLQLEGSFNVFNLSHEGTMKRSEPLKHLVECTCREVINDAHPVPVEAVGGPEHRVFEGSCEPSEEGLSIGAPGKRWTDPQDDTGVAAVTRTVLAADEGTMAGTGVPHDLTLSLQPHVNSSPRVCPLFRFRPMAPRPRRPNFYRSRRTPMPTSKRLLGLPALNVRPINPALRLALCDLARARGEEM